MGQKEVKVLSPLISFVCLWSRGEKLNLQANVSVLSVRMDSNFHLLSTADNQSRMAVVPSPQMRQLNHKVKRLRVLPSQGLNKTPSLPYFPRSWG